VISWFELGYVYLSNSVLAAQVLAACFELAIPHFTSKAIYAVTSGTSQQQFKHYVAMLGTFALGYASCAAVRGALFSIIQNRLSRQLR
jgi:hypothetical protein